jgi:hypothetical protein
MKYDFQKYSLLADAEMNNQNPIAGSTVTKPEKKRSGMDMAGPALIHKFYRVHTSMMYQNLSKTLKKEMNTALRSFFGDFCPEAASSIKSLENQGQTSVSSSWDRTTTATVGLPALAFDPCDFRL